MLGAEREEDVLQDGCICLVTELMDQDLHTALRRQGGSRYQYLNE